MSQATEAKSRGINWRQVAILSMAGCGPAAVIALNLQFMGQFAGAALVFAFVLVWPGVLLLANTFAEFSKRLPSSGGLYTWNSHAWGKNFGFVYGWNFIGAYIVLAAAGFTVFGGWISEWLNSQYGVNVPWWLFTGGAVIYVVILAYMGIQQSLHAALALLGIECAVVFALAVYIIVNGPVSGTGFGVEPFLPSAAGTAGWAGIGLAMTYGVLSHVGVEEGATLAREVPNPKREVPKGLWIAAIVVPGFYVFVSYAMVYGYGIGRMEEFGADDAPLQTLAVMYWGDWGLAIVVAAIISSILAFSQAGFLAGTRVLYTLGKDRMLPQWLSTLSPRNTPHWAVLTMGIITIALGAPLAFITGPFNVWGYFGFLISIAFLVSYIFTNIGIIRYTRRIGEFHWFRHGLLGLLGALIFLYPLYRVVWPLPPGIYGVLPFVYLAWIVLGIAFLMHTRAVRPEVMDEIGTTMAGVEDDHPDADVERRLETGAAGKPATP